MIDAHHHCWRYVPAEFPWIDDGSAMLQRDFSMEEFTGEMDAAGVKGCIAVQARQSLVETRWLLELARRHPRILGVVGWVPLADPGVGGLLDGFAAERGRLVGARHVLHDERDGDFLSRPEIDRGIGLLAARGLAYDLLVRERELPAALACVKRHVDMHFIIDHAAKPRIAQREFEPWRERIRALARLPHVWCKLSGLVTEADKHAWAVDDLRPYASIVIEAFGPRRVLFGSDWPVCLDGTDYARWLRTVGDLISALSASERADILGGAARRAYRLG